MTVFSTDIGTIVGGVIAAVALIVATVLAFLWIRRRRRHPPEAVELYSDCSSPPFTPHTAYNPLFTDAAGTYDPYAGHNPPTNNTARNNPIPSPSTELSPFVPLVPNRLDSPAVQRTPSMDEDILTPFTTTSNTSNSSGTHSKTRGVQSNDPANAPSSQPQIGRDTSPLLTDEQADFINSLHHNNVPAAAIARVMERMLVDRYAGIREWERETRLARTNTMTTAPPSYDLAVERG
jgi:hypothetical protein